MKQGLDLVIAGGGVTGLTMAALLAAAPESESLNITLIEATHRPEFDPVSVALRVSALAAGSAAILDSIGAWQSVVETRACPYDAMRVWDESDEPDGPSTLNFEAADFAVAQLGFIVENALIQHALLKLLDATDVNLVFNDSVASLQLDEKRCTLSTANGTKYVADLLIAADGARSWVRDTAGIEVHRRSYEQTAFVTHFATEYPHKNIARQRFLRDGPLGMLPLADGRISIVWSTSPENADRAQAADDLELAAMLEDVSDHVLGRLTVSAPRAVFPLAAQHASNYVMPRLALIGDAAHTIHPLAGQGANLGLQDADALARVVTEAIKNGEHPGDRPVLRRYERARKGSNLAMMQLMTGLNRLFASDSELLGEVRRAGMRLFNNSGPIRERVVEVALGTARR